MGRSARKLRKCCKIRKKKNSDVKKRKKMSALLKKFTKNQQSSNTICPLCIDYIEPNPEVPEDRQKSAKRVCGSSSKRNTSYSRKSRRTEHPWDTIIINQVPLKLNLKEFTSLFSERGTIEDVCLCKDVLRVRYRHEEDARKVWKDCQEDRIMITLVSKNYSPIQNLPDDCLREIFCRLPIEDKLNVEQVCQRWKTIGSQSWSHVTKIKYGWTSISWKTIAPRTASYLRDLTLTLPEENPTDEENLEEDSPYLTIALVAEHYTLLKRLGISWHSINLEISDKEFSLSIPCLHTIISKNQNLRILYLEYVLLDEGFFDWLPAEIEEIHLVSYTRTLPLSSTPVNLSRFLNLQVLVLFAFDIDEDQLRGIEYLENLRILKFDESNVHGSNVEKIVNFKKLEHLAIMNCQISNLALLKILRSNKDLKYLDISDIGGISDSAFVYVSQVSKLEVLRMRNLREVSYFGPMPKLQSLRANGCSSITDEGIQRLLTRDSVIRELIIPGCSVSLNIFVTANAMGLGESRDRYLFIHVDTETYQLWQKSGVKRLCRASRKHLYVCDYYAAKDYDDPVFSHWLEFDR